MDRRREAIMRAVLKLSGAGLGAYHWLLDWLRRLCRREPLSVHCYALHYLTHEPARTEMMLLLEEGDRVGSYLLVWWGGRYAIQDLYEVYLWKPCKELVSALYVPPSKRVDIQLYDYVPSDIKTVVKHMEGLGFKRFHIGKFYDMVCWHDTFRPSPLEALAVRLGEEHAPLYRELELERGIEIGIEEARMILREYVHYGVIINNTLASIAARYVTLQDIHIIGGVYTRTRYRRRGYATAVTSALTREAVGSGALAVST